MRGAQQHVASLADSAACLPAALAIALIATAQGDYALVRLPLTCLAPASGPVGMPCASLAHVRPSPLLPPPCRSGKALLDDFADEVADIVLQRVADRGQLAEPD